MKVIYSNQKYKENEYLDYLYDKILHKKPIETLDELIKESIESFNN